MEMTRPGCAVIYVILLCALAQGGSEGKKEKEEFYRDGGGGDGSRTLSSFLHLHGKQAEDVWEHCRKELINNGVKYFDLHLLEGGSDMSSLLSIENDIHKTTKSLAPHMRKRVFDCIRTTATPPAPHVSERKTSSRHRLKHSRSTLGLDNDHHGRHLIAVSPHNHFHHSPSPSATSPSFQHEVRSTTHYSTPESSPSSPTPAHNEKEPPPPRQPFEASHIFKFNVNAPRPSPPSNKEGNIMQTTMVIAASASVIVMVLGLCLCFGETRKSDKDDGPLLVLTSSDYSGGAPKVVRLGDNTNTNKEESSTGNGENPSNEGENPSNASNVRNGGNPPNFRNWSMKAGDNHVSRVVKRLESMAKTSAATTSAATSAATTSAAAAAATAAATTSATTAAATTSATTLAATTSEGMAQLPGTPTKQPAPPPPGPLPPKTPGPPVIAPRPPPPPTGAKPPPAPPKPMGGKNQPSPPGAVNQGSSSEGDAPKAKLKPFFWDKVTAKPDQSMVWHEINAGSFVFNEEMMESLFGFTNTNKNERKKDSASADNSVQYIQIIDPKKAQNLSILLRALNVTTEEVVDALREGNEIPVELCQTLLKMAPTTEEELKLRLFTGELSQLGPAERFLKVLTDIPFAFKRLESLMFMFILREEVASIKDSFATLEVACDELRKSRLFLKLLEAVLKTGNRMNDGTYRGGAQAFRLDTLLKLSDVKGTDGKTTLLHFVVQEIIRSEGIRAVRTERASRSDSSVGTDDVDYTNEESEEHYRSLGLTVVSGLSSELGDVKKAALIDGDALTTGVAKLGHSLMKTEEFMNTDMKNLEEECEFQKCMEKFLEHAKEDVTWLLKEEKRIMALVKSTADYFHGNAGKDEGLRLFLIVRDFLIILDKVCKEVRDTTMKMAKANNNNVKKEKEKEKEGTPSVPSSPARQQVPEESPPQPPDLHRRLFPAIAGRRVDYSSSDDDDDDDEKKDEDKDEDF